MPHVILEYSSNVIEKNHFTALFKQLHLLLAEKLPTNIASCKSRAYESSIFSVGNDNPHNAFVHVHIKVLPGRTQTVLQSIGQEIIEILKKHFELSLAKLQLQISLEISELQTTYFKIAGK